MLFFPIYSLYCVIFSYCQVNILFVIFNYCMSFVPYLWNLFLLFAYHNGCNSRLLIRLFLRFIFFWQFEFWFFGSWHFSVVLLAVQRICNTHQLFHSRWRRELSFSRNQSRLIVCLLVRILYSNTLLCQLSYTVVSKIVFFDNL